MRIQYWSAISAFIFLLFISANGALCGGNNEAAESLDKIDKLLIEGENDQAWQVLEDIPEDDLTPDTRLWIKARVQYEIGRTADKDQLSTFKKAEKFARSAIDENADNAEGYKWLAITLGAQAKYSDTKTQVRISKRVKDNIEKAIALAPDDDLSYLVLSRWHYKNSALSGVARTFANILYDGLPKASLKEAEKLLLHAIKLHDRIAHRYNLAKVYNRMERPKDEREQLEKALLLPVTFPEEVKELRKARNKLQDDQ